MNHFYAKNKAFTILELLLAITLIALVAVPSSISLFNFLRQTAVGALVNELDQTIDKARYASSEFNIPAYLNIDPDSGTIELQINNQQNSSANDLFSLAANKISLAGDISIDNISLNGITTTTSSRIIFKPDGTGDYAVITFTAGENTFEYLVSPLYSLTPNLVSGDFINVINLDNTDLVSDDIFK